MLLVRIQKTHRRGLVDVGRVFLIEKNCGIGIAQRCRGQQVWMLIDRSGSMDWAIDSTTQVKTGERWDTLRRVLLGDPNEVDDVGVVGDFQSQVSFGASFFTTTGQATCGLDLVSVDIGFDNYDPIKTQYDALSPGGGTPTAEAINSLAATADATPAGTGPKIIILATDGEPNDCVLPGEPETNVEDAVAAAFGDQILTFLVFIGPDLGASHQGHLQSIANLGVGRPADSATPAEYFTAQNEEKLREAFQAIVGGARGCVFDLEGEVEESGAGLGTVTLSGNTLVYEDENGWRLASPSQVELLGSACDEIKDGETNLDINFPCEVYEPAVAR